MRRYVIATAAAAAALLSACDQAAVNTATKTNTANSANTTANSNTNTAANPAAAEADIKKLMDTAQTALAKNDADAMDRIYAENYMLVNVDGSVQNRTERLAALRGGDTKYSSFAYSEPVIRVNPEATGAVVIAKLDMKGTSRGKPLDGEYRVSQVYTKTKDGWKQVHAQATKIEGGPAASADDKKTDDKKEDETKGNSNK